MLALKVIPGTAAAFVSSDCTLAFSVSHCACAVAALEAVAMNTSKTSVVCPPYQQSFPLPLLDVSSLPGPNEVDVSCEASLCVTTWQGSVVVATAEAAALGELAGEGEVLFEAVFELPHAARTRMARLAPRPANLPFMN